jgi:mannose-1-phosphate guanylyltransferase
LGQLIRAYVGDGSQWGIGVDYADEESPLGTIGPLLMLLDRLPEHFSIMNDDILTDLDYADLFESHVGSGAPITDATHRRHLERYTSGLPFGFDELMLGLLERGTPPGGFAFKGFWLGIERPDGRDRANGELQMLQRTLLPGAR